jgi:hypothetical protein
MIGTQQQMNTCTLQCTGARPMIKSRNNNNDNKNNKIRSVDVIYPTGIIVNVRVKLPQSVSNSLFFGFRIIGRAPAYQRVIPNE